MSGPVLAFGPFHLDPANGCLWRDGRRIDLSPTDFAVLHHLAANAGHIVTHEALLRAVWPDTTVAKEVLKVRLYRIRRALGDRPDRPRFIETAQRRGYRFIAAVSNGSGASAAAAAATREHAAAGRLRSGAPTTFVGREPEMESLRAALADALAGHGRLVTLVGEAGIGKTRAAEELIAEAVARGAEVLVGRCHEGSGTPPYWPWVQIVRAYAGARAPSALARDLGRDAAEIAQLLPELREMLPDLPAPPPLEPEHARFRLFDAMAEFLKRGARHGALVVVLDDLHWADAPSLRLLGFLARELAAAPLLIIVTHRDVELRDDEPLTVLLGELARLASSQRLLLRGLAPADVARFVALVSGHTPAPPLLAALHEVTDGNPFFVTEVVQMLATEGRLAQNDAAALRGIALPHRVREAITHRLRALSPPCRHVLSVASVIGREFGLPLLQSALAGAPPRLAGAELLMRLDEAASARFIDVDGGAGGRYAFCHPLIRQTLYDSVRSAQRVRLHRRIGMLLEEQRNGDRSAPVAALAAHFCLAAPGGAVEKAIAYATRAGEQAMAALAYEEAAEHYARALQALELRPDAARRSALLLELGEAQRQAGQTSAAKETFAAAAAIARARAAQVGAQEVAPFLARAALGVATGFAGFSASGGMPDTFVLDLLQEALRAFGDREGPLRARVLGRLAVELYWSADPERRAALSQQAVEMARRSGDRATLAYALNARCLAVWTPDTVAERLETAAEIMRLAEAAGDRDLALRGHMRRLGALLELGELRSADRELAEYAQRARALRQPSHLWFLATWRAMRAGMSGDFERAETLAREAYEIGERAQDPDAAQCYTVQIFAFRSGRRPPDDIELPARNFAAEFAAVPAWRAATALVYADLGLDAAARQEFEQIAANDFADLPRNDDWMIAMATLSQLCAYLRDGARGALLYEQLRPYAQRCVVVGHGLVCLGSVERFLALLAASQRRWEEAEAHFHAAVQHNRALGAVPLVVLTQREQAMMLLARDRGDDRARARQLLTETLAVAQRLGMDEQFRRWLAKTPGADQPT
jgi:DNA-binding winged helix-turn-helix (wHTH) protein